MWKKSAAFAGILGLIVLLDPTPTDAQPPGGFNKGGFNKGGDRPPGGATAPGAAPGTPGSPPTTGGNNMTRPMGGGDRQPGGNNGGRPRFGPEESWSFMQRLTQSTGDTIDTGKIPAQSLAWLKSSNEKSGGLPLPENVVMTKGQFLEHFARSEQAKADFAARGGAATVTAPGGPPMGDRGQGGMGDRGQGGFGGRGPGGPGGGMMGDPAEMAAQRIRDQDRNGDGKISMEEADGRLRDRFRDIDRNGDGFIEAEEYTAYYRERFGGGGPGGPGGSGDPNNPNGQPAKRDTEEERPVAMRYGKLPKDLPGWYDELDKDKDGQVSLFEWRNDKREMKEFQEMDLNADGLVTADEYLRFARQKNIQTKVDAYVESDGAVRPTNWGVSAPVDAKGDKNSRGPGGNKGDRPSSDSKPADSKPGDKGERKNPWSGGKGKN